jgi:hypothetical protein
MKIKNFLINIFVLIASLLFLFFFIELGFKALHFFSDAEVSLTSIEGLPYENTPNGWFLRYSKVSGWVFYKHNSLGMRDVERDFEKRQGNRRILVLGDSVMYGGEVKFENIFSRQLEKMFNSDDVEVLNCGVTSYSLKEYPVYLREKGVRFSPDLVVLGLCLNDYNTAIHEKDRGENNREKGSVAKENFWLNKFKRLFHSYFIEYLKNVYEVIRGEKLEFAYSEFYAKEVWGANRGYFEEIKNIANDHGADFIVLILPTGLQFGEKEGRNVPQKHITEILDELSIRHVNPFFVFEDEIEKGTVIFKNDPTHFSEEGHRLCAEETFKLINNEDLINADKIN